MRIDIRLILQDLRQRRDLVDAVIASLTELYGDALEEEEMSRPAQVKVPRQQVKASGARDRTRIAEAGKTASVPGTKPCRKCGAVKTLDQFCVNHTCSDGHTHECNECAYARAKAKYRARHEKAGGAGNGEKALECNACHARFATPIAKKNHNCARPAAAGNF